jgi:anti-sigma B factor antagonist
MARLRLSTRKHDEVVAVMVTGELDIATAPGLKSHLHKIMLTKPGQVIIDLGGVSFIDAAGLGALVVLKDCAESQHTALRLADVSASILRLMKLTKLDSHFDLVPANGHAAGADTQEADTQPRAAAAITLLRGPGAWTRRSPHMGGPAA